ncbi:hypothetical protein B0I35DRAFT_514149 [Stachybotrys elegans]|uniref:Zn(2)-C6 fungal-type domain-containing protein n=1 Tax=Stachybotrys elegans TaxID=80388 RepID=A0A8K0WNF8_9HYPO|nr:hypothetical protein B0I35DRAFT_514149 [Stachybotrys elegans]
MDLTCDICGKESSSKITLKRHLRYCRKKGLARKTRVKSCQACIRAKTRCEPDITACTRCTEKGLQCSLLPLLDSFSIADLNHSNVALQDRDGHVNPPLQTQLPFDFLFQPTAPSDVRQDGIALQEAKQLDFHGLQDAVVPQNSRLYEPRVFQTPSNMMGSTIGTGILRSYPSMMVDRKTLPAFIHPMCFGSESNNWTLPKSLENAIVVSKLFASRSPEALPMIRQEQQRISDEAEEMGLEDMLSSCQALLIYVLMRICDGVSEDPEDGRLNQLLFQLCCRIPCLGESYAEMKDLSVWKQWVIVESKRRANNVLRLMWQLYDLGTGPSCLWVSAYTAMPLPASKALWKASNEDEWDKERRASAHYSKLSHQDLMNFKGSVENDVPSKDEWSRWYSDTDELGILVAISTSLL